MAYVILLLGEGKQFRVNISCLCALLVLIARAFLKTKLGKRLQSLLFFAAKRKQKKAKHCREASDRREQDEPMSPYNAFRSSPPTAGMNTHNSAAVAASAVKHSYTLPSQLAS